MVPAQVTMAAPAKVNLSLRVTGRYADGRHELDAPTVPLALADTVTVTARGDGVICNDWRLPDAAPDDELGRRAARALAHAADSSGGATIRIHKRVPVGAGLGGGSSDAAAVLLACNRLWRLRWPLRRLAELGATLGADVPFFVHCRQARIGGGGERLTPLPRREGGWLVLLAPRFMCPTGDVFAAYDRLDLQNATIQATISTCVQQANDLLPAAMSLHPSLGEGIGALRAAAGNATMSGSGSACFARLPSRKACADVVRKLSGLPHELLVTRIMSGRTRLLLGSGQAVRQRILAPSCVGSNPTSPALVATS